MDRYFDDYDVFLASSKFNSIGANEKNLTKFYTSAFFFKRNDQVRLNLVNIFNSLEDFGFYHLVLLSVINDLYTPWCKILCSSNVGYFKVTFIEVSTRTFFNKRFLDDFSKKYGTSHSCSIFIHIRGSSWHTFRVLLRGISILMVGDNKNISHILSTNAFLLSKFIFMVFKSDKSVKDSFNFIGKRTLITRSVVDFTKKFNVDFSKELIDVIRLLPESNRNNLSDLGIFGDDMAYIKNIAYKYKTPRTENHSYNKLTSSKLRDGSQRELSQIYNKRGFNTISFINKAIVVKQNKFLLTKQSWKLDGRLIFWFSLRLDYLNTNFWVSDLLKSCLKGYYGLSNFKCTFDIPSNCLFKVNNGRCNKLSFPLLNYGNKHERRYSSLVGKANRYVLFKKVKNILTNDPINAKTQRKIENLLVNYSIKDSKGDIMIWDFIARLDERLKRELFRCSSELEDLISNFVVRNLQPKGENEKASKKHTNLSYLYEILSVVPVNFVVSLLIGNVLNLLNSTKQEDTNTANVFSCMGAGLINHYFYLLFKKQYLNKSTKYLKYNMRDWKLDNTELIEKFDSVVTHGIGALLADWLRDVKLLELSVVSCLKDKHKLSVLIPSTNIRDKFKIKQKKPLVLPAKIPMIVKPNEYKRVVYDDGKTREELGGYLLNGEYYSNELIIKNWRSKVNSKIQDVNVIYRTINNMASVGYKINKDVLEFISMNDRRLELTKINLTHPFDEKLCDKKLNKIQKTELESFNSKKQVEETILALADTLENVNEFFIPVRMDFRGRIYCEADYLNYQGTDLAKSLLLFAKGEKILKSDISSINYFKIFGANCFGLDKFSFTDRIKWVDVNIENIRNFNNGILIKKAKHKFMFIAFCFEYNRWLHCLSDCNSSEFTTFLPVQLDASCNGYQHISMLVKDLDLAKYLNLNKSKPEDVPEDFYSIVASYLDVFYNSKLNSSDLYKKDRDSIIRLKSLDISRSIIKKAIMTIPYNASALQLIKYLQEEFEYDEDETRNKNGDIDSNLFNEEIDSLDFDEDSIKIIENEKDSKKEVWFKHRDNSKIKLENLDFLNLYRGLDYILLNIFPSLKHISKYFKDIANVCTKIGISIPWYLPTGLIAHQSYMALKAIRVKPFNYSNETFSLRIPIRDVYDDKKQKRALMPNLIHSLDSTSLVLMTDKYFKELDEEHRNIYAVHDCFGATCNNMWYIVNTLKLVYISLYTAEGYLKKFDDGLIKHIKEHIGDAFCEKDRLILLGTSKPLKYPDVEKVIKETYNVELLRESSYIIL